ncbi:MAG: hypothetical protein JXL80_12725, partial [Planctomycetes bacterium]|nr:hypothetical protein [Planctomycetota bacterium]
NFVEGMYMGIEGGGSDVRIACNKVYKTQFGMLSNSGGKGWLIERNGIERQFQHRAGDCDYSRMWGQEHLIRHNRYYATQRSEVGKAHLDCVQSFNVKKDNPGMFLHHLTFEGNVCDSFSQVFMLSTSTPGTHHHFTFKGNIMYNSGSWGFCVKTIPDCTAVNNTFAGIKWYGFGNAGAERGRANYNLYASINTPYTTGPGFEGKGNLVFDCENPPKEPAAGEMIQGDPKFVDAAKGNFRLTAGSAAIDAGPDGLDIGALEYPNVYYVDAEHPGADDEGFGYVGWPFKTVAKACSVAQAGETIMLRGGTYRETIKPQADGVTIRAMADETVTVSGADLVTEWKRDGEVWAAAMETAPAKLLVDGKPSESVAYDAAAKRVVARSMDPRLHTVEAVVRERAVDLTGRKDVRVDGLNCADTLGEPVAK